MLFKRLGLDLDGREWPVVALWLFGLDLALFLVSRAVDFAWFSQATPAFFAATLAYLALIWIDAQTIGIRRAWLWALLATFLPLLGHILYARHRCRLRRTAIAG